MRPPPHLAIFLFRLQITFDRVYLAEPRAEELLISLKETVILHASRARNQPHISIDRVNLHVPPTHLALSAMADANKKT